MAIAYGGDTGEIASPLSLVPLNTSITWERTPHPVRRPAVLSHLISSTMVLNLFHGVPNHYVGDLLRTMAISGLSTCELTFQTGQSLLHFFLVE